MRVAVRERTRKELEVVSHEPAPRSLTVAVEFVGY